MTDALGLMHVASGIIAASAVAIVPGLFRWLLHRALEAKDGS